MNHKEKILKYLDYKGVNPNQFYRKCAFGNGFLNSGKYFGTDKLVIILDNYRDININWLLFDEGNMILDEKRLEVNEQPANYAKETINSLKQTIAAQDETIQSLKAQMRMLDDKGSSKAS